jgi:transcriptional regulator with XRE-family HTH domain
MTSKAYFDEIKRKIKRYRIENSLTQKEIASMTGLSIRSVQRFENGEDISLENFLKILIALNLVDVVNSAIPDLDNRPSAYIDRIKRKEKKRARKPKESQIEFKWGDEK